MPAAKGNSRGRGYETVETSPVDRESIGTQGVSEDLEINVESDGIVFEARVQPTATAVGRLDLVWQVLRGRAGGCFLALAAVALAFAAGTTVGNFRVDGTRTKFGPSASPGWGWAPLPFKHQELAQIAFGSCAHQQYPQPFWDVLVTVFKPELYIAGGDNVYGDCLTANCTELRLAYDTLANHPSFRGAKSVLPMVAVIDDHDSGQNDAGADNPYKDIAKQMVCLAHSAILPPPSTWCFWLTCDHSPPVVFGFLGAAGIGPTPPQKRHLQLISLG